MTPEAIAELWVNAVRLYAMVGLAFAVVFVLFLVQRIDPAAKGSGIAFRVILIPSATVLWPLLAWRVVTKRQPPTERNAHRAGARQ